MPQSTIVNKPPWVQPRIKAAPKIRQIYWCDYWKDARLPEMWKTRPVIVVSYKNTLHGPCLVVPVSTEPQDNNLGSPAFDQQGVAAHLRLVPRPHLPGGFPKTCDRMQLLPYPIRERPRMRSSPCRSCCLCPFPDTPAHSDALHPAAQDRNYENLR